MALQSSPRRFFRYGFLLVLLLHGFLSFPVRASDEDAGEVEILRAFQERYLAGTGVYFDWRKSYQENTSLTYPSYPNPPMPVEGDFTQAQLDIILGNHIWSHLQRWTSDTYRPLMYLSDDRVDGAKTWADVQKKILRLSLAACRT